MDRYGAVFTVRITKSALFECFGVHVANVANAITTGKHGVKRFVKFHSRLKHPVSTVYCINSII